MILHWISVKTGTWHWFALKGAGPRPLFAFAGLWQRHVGPVKKDGAPVEIDVYSFMTTTPNALVEAINHERMPVLLSTDEPFDTWINGPADQLELALLLCRFIPWPMRSAGFSRPTSLQGQGLPLSGSTVLQCKFVAASRQIV